MKRHWRWLFALPVAGLVALSLIVASFELGCRGGTPGFSPGAPYEAIWTDPADTRIEARSWLTYPEWHIVYSAEDFAASLQSVPPSQFAYGREVMGFWSSYCAVNHATSGMSGRTNYKVTIYTIGLSFTAELAVKAAYEKTVGRFFERASGWDSESDRYAARVQQDYGHFLHEPPWYRYPFASALSGLWSVDDDGHHVRQWERRLALSAEYGTKAIYAKIIAAAVGASGYDERTLRFVVAGRPSDVEAIDRRLGVKGEPRPGLLLVDAPRYEQFTELVSKLARSDLRVVEIAGNDDILITVMVPPGFDVEFEHVHRLFALVVDGRPGLERAGLSVKVPELLATIRQIEAAGGSLEHIYDY